MAELQLLPLPRQARLESMSLNQQQRLASEIEEQRLCRPSTNEIPFVPSLESYMYLVQSCIFHSSLDVTSKHLHTQFLHHALAHARPTMLSMLLVIV